MMGLNQGLLAIGKVSISVSTKIRMRWCRGLMDPYLDAVAYGCAGAELYSREWSKELKRDTFVM